MSITLENLLNAGAHFGHQTHRWNPKMKPYIFGARNGIYIINLEKTLTQWNEARHAIEKVVAQGGKLMFVGTKPQAAEIIEEEAKRADQYFVNRRWLGGMLTNFPTIELRINRLKELETFLVSEDVKDLPKKEVSRLEKEKIKLERSLSGIKNMKDLPKMLVVVDPNKEHLACAEARNLNIPIVAIVDTNCDPDGIDFVVPANDDALKSIRLFFTEIANTCLEGSKTYESVLRKQEATKKVDEQKTAKADKAEDKSTEKKKGPVVERKKATQETTTNNNEESVNA
ncbi:MAG: 30S ribosomal protein S2 [Bdellovibrionales bacterium]|nr:30S ribosomal protein S2 [Bdellovibrionales bacterium]